MRLPRELSGVNCQGLLKLLLAILIELRKLVRVNVHTPWIVGDFRAGSAGVLLLDHSELRRRFCVIDDPEKVVVDALPALGHIGIDNVAQPEKRPERIVQVFLGDVLVLPHDDDRLAVVLGRFEFGCCLQRLRVEVAILVGILGRDQESSDLLPPAFGRGRCRFLRMQGDGKKRVGLPAFAKDDVVPGGRPCQGTDPRAPAREVSRHRKDRRCFSFPRA